MPPTSLSPDPKSRHTIIIISGIIALSSTDFFFLRILLEVQRGGNLRCYGHRRVSRNREGRVVCVCMYSVRHFLADIFAFSLRVGYKGDSVWAVARIPSRCAWPTW